MSTGNFKKTDSYYVFGNYKHVFVRIYVIRHLEPTRFDWDVVYNLQKLFIPTDCHDN